MKNLTHLDVDGLEAIAGKKMLIRVELAEDEGKAWCQENAQHVERLLSETGALLIRGLTISGSKKFAGFLTSLFQSELQEYNYRSTPRTELRGNIYTATEYHAAATIVQHNECAYANDWPMRLGLACLTPARSGGETPISDSAEVLRRLPASIVDEFQRRGVMYVRNYSEVDLPWTEVFQTSKRSDVDRYCAAHGIGCEWREDGSLRTWQVNPAVVHHPRSGKPLWFNQAHLFHVSALPPEDCQHLRDVFPEERLPRHVYFGDGAPIPAAVIATINAIYREQQIAFPWQENDLLLLDNMMYTHGRNPYQGERKVIVGMARSYREWLAAPACKPD
jgi:alpha-ketoglutarate-dependent taurine dioxygenase